MWNMPLLWTWMRSEMALKLMEVMIIFLSSHLFSDLVNDICRSHYIAIEGFLDFFFCLFFFLNFKQRILFFVNFPCFRWIWWGDEAGLGFKCGRSKRANWPWYWCVTPFIYLCLFEDLFISYICFNRLHDALFEWPERFCLSALKLLPRPRRCSKIKTRWYFSFLPALHAWRITSVWVCLIKS